VKPLQLVRRRARAYRAAEDAYRDALVAAADAGHTFAEIGAAAEVTRQVAHKVIRRRRRKAQ
jgi:DNA-directed RNA polymerase specialized sigma24 family protein